MGVSRNTTPVTPGEGTPVPGEYGQGGVLGTSEWRATVDVAGTPRRPLQGRPRWCLGDGCRGAILSTRRGKE